jgi:hypothetical protein
MFGLGGWICLGVTILALGHDVLKFNPFQWVSESKPELPEVETVTKVKPVAPGLLQALQQSAELSTIKATIQTVIPVTEVQNVPILGDMVQGSLIYISVGSVQAGIDLRDIKENMVEELPGKVVVTLPIVRILNVQLDLNKSKVFSYKKDMFAADNAIKMQDKAQKTAQESILRDACNNGILKSATEQSQFVVKNLLSMVAPAGTIIEVKPAPFEPKCEYQF